MLRIAERKDASDELKCAAVTVIKELDETNSDAMESVIKKIGNEEMRRVISVAMDMMS
ncbi:importin-like protein, partial [Trifolium medium]|nr:importin-like protein [Trifolium medium]